MADSDCKKKNVMTPDFSGLDSGSSRKRKKRRLRANGREGLIKQEGKLNGSSRDVSIEEHDRILIELRKVDWASVVNTSRKNVIDPKKCMKTASGQAFCQSFILGPNMKSPNRQLSYWTTAYPRLVDLLTKLMNRFNPNHKWTNITVNRNFICKPHRDKGNNGASYIVGFGAYEGGELSLERIGGDAQAFEKKDIHRKFTRFYGGRQMHWTEPFKGERFSCVFYDFPEVHEKARLSASRENHSKSKNASVNENAISSDAAKKFREFKKRIGNKQRL